MAFKPSSGHASESDVHTTLLHNGWAALDDSNKSYCLTLSGVCDMTLNLDVDGETYRLKCLGNTVDLKNWGFPNALTADVASVLTCLLKQLRICLGAKKGSQSIPLKKNITVHLIKGIQHVRDARCTGLLPLLSLGDSCHRCWRTLSHMVYNVKRKVSTL